jgi:hypothetical protein
MTTNKGWVSGPRWGQIKKGLKELAWEHNLDIKCDVEKGLLTETVFYKVSGEENNINKFIKDVEEICE